MAVANTLAYYDVATIVVIKSFILNVNAQAYDEEKNFFNLLAIVCFGKLFE
jgi:hypothetical protein